MESELIAGYILHIDGKAAEVGRSLEEAKRLAENYIPKKYALQIKSAVAPAPTQVWNYDYDLKSWVERI